MLMIKLCLEYMHESDDEEMSIHRCDRCGKDTMFSGVLDERVTERCLEDDCVRDNIDLYINFLS